MKTILAALAVSLSVSAASAQQNCAPREQVVEMLTEQYGESVQSMGINNGVVIEMWANVETGTWTILMTRPDGISCAPADGNGFERVDSEVSPTGARL